MSEFVSKYVVCPFYRRHDNNRICCEGTNNNNTINLVFGDSKQLKKYTATFCESMDNYQRCMICATLYKKYPTNNSP